MPQTLYDKVEVEARKRGEDITTTICQLTEERLRQINGQGAPSEPEGAKK